MLLFKLSVTVCSSCLVKSKFGTLNKTEFLNTDEKKEFTPTLGLSCWAGSVEAGSGLQIVSFSSLEGLYPKVEKFKNILKGLHNSHCYQSYFLMQFHVFSFIDHVSPVLVLHFLKTLPSLLYSNFL